MAEQKASMGLRIFETIGGIIVLFLGAYVLAYPGAAIATLILFVAIGLIILGIVTFIRVFESGISGWRRLLNLILAVLLIIVAGYVIANPFIYGSLTLVYLLDLGLIFAGMASIARGTPRNDSRWRNRRHPRLWSGNLPAARLSLGPGILGCCLDHIWTRSDFLGYRREMDVIRSLPIFSRPRF